jgi:hypothetical protein
LPSQLTAGVELPFVHFAAPHDTVVAANEQAVLVPSQRLPQVPAAQAGRPPRGACPAGSTEHFPIEPVKSHA